MPHTRRHATHRGSGTPSARELFAGRALVVLAVLACVRVIIPLAALAASGHALPGLPRYDYTATTGDGAGFYAATREFLASWGRLPPAVVVALAVAGAAGGGALVWAWRGRKVPRAWLIVLGAAGFSGIVAVGVTQMEPSGAAVFGWPLVWSLPMLPYRALGFPLDPDIAFGFGLVLSLLANVVTVGATAAAGLYATGRRSPGLLAAALFAFWPLLVGLIGGEDAWGNGTWTVDAGLVMYTEPLSTALVTLALALLLAPRPAPARLAVAGVALGVATAVKLTNGLLAAAALIALVYRLGPRRTLPFAAGGISLVPVVASFWPKGYQALFDDPNSWPRRPFSVDYVDTNWSDSLLFGPQTLLALVPLAVLGSLAVRAWWPLVLLGVWVLLNPVFYSLYRVTFEHPRFLFASLPAVFVLWAAGAATIPDLVSRARHPRAVSPSA